MALMILIQVKNPYTSKFSKQNFDKKLNCFQLINFLEDEKINTVGRVFQYRTTSQFLLILQKNMKYKNKDDVLEVHYSNDDGLVTDKYCLDHNVQ